MSLRFPSLGPPLSLEIREECPDLALPIEPSPTPPDLLAPPWQLWTSQLGYPPYEVNLGEGPIILPNVCFGTHLGVPWQLGKQAPDGETYARRVVSTPCHHPYLPQYPGVLDNELGIFLKDATFNFALNQSVEYTDDPGLVADVGLYHHLASEAAGWKAHTDQLNKFGVAYHRMQETFMGGYSAYTMELKAVEEHLVAARARTRVHAAMVQLISQGQLGGRHCWMGLPGLDAHPCPQILPEPPCFIMAKDLESQVYIPVPVPPPSHLPCVTDAPPSPSPSSSSISSFITEYSPAPKDRHSSSKCPKNVWPHCGKSGHFGRECKTPHIYCANCGYCKLRAKSDCKYPCAHGRQARIMHKKIKAQAGSGGDSRYVAGINEQELAINAGSVLFDMDWSN